jgi:hypothetical protein
MLKLSECGWGGMPTPDSLVADPARTVPKPPQLRGPGRHTIVDHACWSTPACARVIAGQSHG